MALFLPVGAHAGIIDFETVPGGTPSDQLAITSQYQSAFGVTFGLSPGGSPTLEKTGDSDVGNGFRNDQLGLFDKAAAGYESVLGNCFLRMGTTELASSPVPILRIDYASPVSGCSANIWDIDGWQGTEWNSGTEQSKIEAFDSSSALLETILSPEGSAIDATSLDGKPWTWYFSRPTADISRIDISFTGSKTAGIGLAFDNFSPTAPIPEPSTFALLLLAAGTGAVALRKRRKS